MNMLIDLLPEYVELGGAEYPINTDFRVSILFELMMEDASVPEDQKAIKAVKLFYPELPPVGLLHEAVKALLWFYQAGKEQKVPKYKTNAEDDESDEAETDDYVERIYSFEHDDDYIYSAFLSQYRIDLQDIEYLHWWKFRAMFRALDEDCQFCKIMSYRSIKINNDMTKSQKAFYRRMKSVHALPVPQEERERIDSYYAGPLKRRRPYGPDMTGGGTCKRKRKRKCNAPNVIIKCLFFTTKRQIVKAYLPPAKGEIAQPYLK